MIEYIPAKTIVTRNKGTSWFGCEYNMNIYRGCCHGCIYCDSRSDCYRNPDFDTVKPKAEALKIIRDDLRRKVRRGVVGTGAMSDPYNPLERELCLTRHALELIHAFRFGVFITTKSDLVVRDIDILSDIAQDESVLVAVTITAQDELARIVEPGAPSSSERFAAIQKLQNAGIHAGVMMMPILPFITDTDENMLHIIHQAEVCGANFIYPSFGVTLRDGQRAYYYHKLQE